MNLTFNLLVQIMFKSAKLRGEEITQEDLSEEMEINLKTFQRWLRNESVAREPYINLEKIEMGFQYVYCQVYPDELQLYVQKIIYLLELLNVDKEDVEAINIYYTKISKEKINNLEQLRKLVEFMYMRVMTVPKNSGSRWIRCCREWYDSRVKNRAISIIDELLPPLRYAGKEKSTQNFLEIFQIYQEKNDNRRHMLLTGEGGAGKSSWMFSIWKHFLKKNQFGEKIVIPIFIPVGEVNGMVENPLYFYMYLHYNPFEENDFMMYIQKFNRSLKNRQDIFLFILDGFNENSSSQGIRNDIQRLREISNVTLLISSRSQRELQNYSLIELQPLNIEEQVKPFLQKKDIIQKWKDFNLLELLTNPMMLTLFTDTFQSGAYNDWKDEVKKNVQLDAATLMHIALQAQIKKPQFSALDRFLFQILIPLMVVELEKDTDCKMNVSRLDMIKACFQCLNHLHLKMRLYEDCLFAIEQINEEDSMEFLDEIDTSNNNYANKQKWIKRILQFTVEKMALLYKIEEDQYKWSHENIKDWFWASGMKILLSVEYEEGIKKMKYFRQQEMMTKSSVFEDSVSLHKRVEKIGKFQLLCKMMKDDKIVHSSFEFFHLLYDLLYTYEEIGYTEKVYIISDILYKWTLEILNEDPLEEEKKYLCLNALSLISYSKLHLKDFAYQLSLNQAEKDLGLALEKVSELDSFEGKELKTRILGNLGAFWLAKFKIEECKNFSYLFLAQRHHQEGLELRQQMIQNETDQKKYELLELGIATSYTCLATDLFYQKNYDQSVYFHEKAYIIRKKYNRTVQFINLLRIAGSKLHKISVKKQSSEKEVLLILKNISCVAVNAKKNMMMNEAKEVYNTFDDFIENLSYVKLSENVRKKMLSVAQLVDDMFFSIYFWDTEREKLSLKIKARLANFARCDT